MKSNNKNKSHIDLISINSNEEDVGHNNDDHRTNLDDEEYFCHNDEDQEEDIKAGPFSIYDFFGKHSDNNTSSINCLFGNP